MYLRMVCLNMSPASTPLIFRLELVRYSFDLFITSSSLARRPRLSLPVLFTVPVPHLLQDNEFSTADDHNIVVELDKVLFEKKTSVCCRRSISTSAQHRLLPSQDLSVW